MSLKEYSSLLKESLSAAPGGGGGGSSSSMDDNGGPLRVEHVFVFAMDAAVARIADAVLDLAREAAHSSRIVAYGVSVFFVLYGVSKLLPGSHRKDRGDTSNPP